MKRENTAIRLKRIMSDRNLRQVDILNKTVPYCKKYDVKMNKSDISQYCSGKSEPNQDKLFVLGMALNVSEAWLMGFDVPMERSVKATNDPPTDKIFCETKSETHLMQTYRKLTDISKKKVNSYTDNLLKIERADLEVKAAHERTDIEVTDEMRKHDDDIMSDENF